MDVCASMRVLCVCICDVRVCIHERVYKYEFLYACTRVFVSVCVRTFRIDPRGNLFSFGFGNVY